MFVDIQKHEAIVLNTVERKFFIEAVEPTLRIDNQEQFFRWTQIELQRILPHGLMACGCGRISQSEVQIQHIICGNFPKECVQILQRPDGQIVSPIMKKWFSDQQPVLFELDAALAAINDRSEWLNNFHRFGIVNMAAYGQCDVGSHTASYFTFSRIPGRLTARHAYLLKLLVPHMHVVLARVVKNLPVKMRKPVPQQSPLTAREREVLEWMCGGKSNCEIAQVMCISEATVKNHVHRILLRLSVNTRTQAVVKAINFKLVRAHQRHQNRIVPA